MASKFKGSKSDLLKNMKKESKSATKKADAKAVSDKNPTPKKFQGADKAESKIKAKDAKVTSDAGKAARRAFNPETAASPAGASEPGTADLGRSPARQLLDRIRTGGMPKELGMEAEGAPSRNPMDKGSADLGQPSAGGPSAARPMSRLGAGASVLGAVGIAAAFASLVSGVDNPVKYYQDMLSSWHKQDEQMAGEASVAREMRNVGPVGSQPMQSMGAPSAPGPVDTAPAIADERAQLAGTRLGNSPSPAASMRNSARSSVRETGGPLSDEEIFAWNRKNNANYRD